MFVKLLSVIVLAMVTQTFGQYTWDENIEEIPEVLDMPCDKAYCSAPCPGAAPPKYCPANFTVCSSGCACMLECGTPTYTCYQIKYCQSRRRYLPKLNTPLMLQREETSL